MKMKCIIRKLNIVSIFAAIVIVSSLNLFISCGNNSQNLEDEKDAMRQAITNLMLSDSLRSVENQELYLQIEKVIYENCTIKNGRMELTGNKKEWKKRGIPDIYYEILKQEIVDINNWLDTTSYPFVHLFEESWQNSCEEYFHVNGLKINNIN